MVKATPYIGITGINTPAEAQQITEFLHHHKVVKSLNTYASTPYMTMLGVTCSNKRLKDPTSAGKTSPSLNNLVKIFEAMPSYGCIPMLHYFTDNGVYLHDEIKEILNRKLPTDGEEESLYPVNCAAIQINQEWPEPEVIKLIRTLESERPLNLVLQLPATALQQPVENIVARAKGYPVDYFLIDPSGGQGVDLDLDRCADLLIALDDALPKARIGVAGGFSAINVEERITKLYEKVKRPFCVDAQGKLRTNDKLDLDRVFLYLKNACKAFQECLK